MLYYFDFAYAQQGDFVSSRITVVIASVFLAGFCLVSCSKSPLPKDTVASIDGVHIKYDSVGSGSPALVFIHGWAGDRSFWDNQSRYFSERYRVVHIDLAGHGESGHGRKVYSIPAFGADVAAVVEKLGLKQVILIGHSLGGPAALEAEKRLGDRVIGVVGVDIFYGKFVPLQGELAEMVIAPFREDFPKAMKDYIASMFMPTTDKTQVDRFAAHVVETSRKKVVIGSLEELFAWYRSEAQAELNRVGGKLRNINANPHPKNVNKPHPSVVLIPGSGHFIEHEKPAEFNRVLEGMIKQFADGDRRN